MDQEPNRASLAATVYSRGRFRAYRCTKVAQALLPVT